MIEKTIRNATRIFVINQLGEILAIKYHDDAKRIPGFYDLPGGKIENGESSYDCVIRETLEETGINITEPLFIGNIKLENDTTIFNFTVFVKTIDKVSLSRVEINDTEWIIDENIRDKNITPVLAVRSLMYDALHQNKHFHAEIISTGPKESIMGMKYEVF